MTTRSARQTRGIAEAVSAAAKERLQRHGRIEGRYHSPWLLVDFGSVVVHVLTEEARAFYSLDELWGDAAEVPQQGCAGQAGA